MKENFYALLLCILRPVTVDQSFSMLNGNFNPPRGRRKLDINSKDLVEDRNKGMTFQQIGDKYGLSKSATILRIKRYLNKVEY